MRRTIRCSVRVVFVAAMWLLLVMPATYAGGFYLSVVGSPSSVGTAGAANVTNRWGADSAWTNPAGMTGLDGSVILTGQQLLIPKMEYDPSVKQGGRGDDGDNAGSTVLIPGIFWVTPISDKWRFGLSMVAPLGGAYDFGNTWAGRYIVQRIALEGVGLSPAVGVQVSESVSIGFGATISFTSFEYDFAINRTALPGSSKDGQARIKDATDTGVQGFVGLQWEYSEGGVFGVVYRSELDMNLEGDVRITRLADMGRARETDIKIEWDNPQLLEIGIRQRLTDEWSLVVTADWEDWSAFGNNVFTFDGSTVVTIDRKWKDTYKFAAGAIWKGDTHGIGFGASYDSSPVSDENRTMDLPVDEQFGVGFSYVRDKENKKINWALSANLTWFGDGKVDQTQQGERFVGEFDKNYAMFLAFTGSYRFGRS